MAAAAVLVALCCAMVARAAEPPIALPADTRMMIVRLPDDTLMGNFD